MKLCTFRVAVVVPCYNEAARLSTWQFSAFRALHPSVEFYFVDDGSTDGTRALLRAMQARDPSGVEVIEVSANGGKAAAVRLGMQRALADAPRYVGYWDADLATPLVEIPRFVEVLESDRRCEVLIGSRAKLVRRLLGRRVLRHYLGRLFAGAASLALGLPLRDTQCGAKLFRFRADLKPIFDRPFRANWAFDVEMIARLLRQRRRRQLPDDNGWIREQPLSSWSEVPGSKVRPRDLAVALADLARIYNQTRVTRRIV